MVFVLYKNVGNSIDQLQLVSVDPILNALTAIQGLRHVLSKDIVPPHRIL